MPSGRPLAFRVLHTFAVVAFATALLSPRTSLAQADDARQSAAARALFQEGVTFADAEQWAEAADRFERAFALRASPNIENNLATAYERLGRIVEAVERFRHVAAASSVDRRIREAARQRIRALEPRIGRILVRVDGSLDGVSLVLDGRDFPVAAVGVATPADPGARSLVATREAVEVGRVDVAVPEGGEVQATLVISAPAPAPVARVTSASEDDRPAAAPAMFAPDAPREDSSSVASNPWLWVGVGVGVAAIAAGVTAAVLLTSGGDPSVEGNTNPPVLRF